jgi:AraC-like DNA-binding protein
MDHRQLLEDVYFVMLYGGVTMLCVVAAIYLLFRKANVIAPEVTSPVRLRRWTAAFLLTNAFSHVWWLMGVYTPLTKVPVVGYSVLCCLDILTVLPTMMGTLLGMLQDKRRPLWPFCLALLPLVLLYFLYIALKDDVYLTSIYVYILSFIVFFTLFMVFAVRHYGRWLQDNYADLEHKEIRKSLLVLAVFLIFFAMYERADTGRVVAYLLQVDILVLTGLLIWRVETLQELNSDALSEEAPAESERMAASTLIPTNIGPLLEKKCEAAQLYLQHDLTLAQLAQAIGTNHSYLSRFFAQQGLTYNAYINGLRVRHFIRLYQEAVSEQRIFTAQQLSYESGFHSYSTFSAAFKQNTGQTVTAWMKDSER